MAEPSTAYRRVPGWAGVAAAGAALGVLTGTALVVLAVVAGPGPGLTGYVSEAGVAESEYAWPYRIGVFSLATALFLLALALRAESRSPGLTRVEQPGVATVQRLAGHRGVALLRQVASLGGAVVLLVVGGLTTLLSGAVTCSAGCPLPPFEPATVADLVHGGASVAATAAVVFAMIAVALAPQVDQRLRRPATIAAMVALPLAVSVAAAMLFVGRGSLVGVLERLVLAVIVVWGLTTALTLASARRPERS
ncbi:DUF998 domain-containing protein [Micromonospora craniellae]|uniref:DUF998 domain-containing protein n=1 Tax=Micromonospora craniellae TaxID=2294034 RepID=A0A372G470_9ACTN|nr:DUF998 domain-containing protein [Micromonospora craniellae]QOC93037.1 DUF998 domain-containing protein [Micromonospora craniellae]RFS47815.1 DUF998 domain-containing protein [Micromonospora craniellae]